MEVFDEALHLNEHIHLLLAHRVRRQAPAGLPQAHGAPGGVEPHADLPRGSDGVIQPAGTGGTLRPLGPHSRCSPARAVTTCWLQVCMHTVS